MSGPPDIKRSAQYWVVVRQGRRIGRLYWAGGQTWKSSRAHEWMFCIGNPRAAHEMANELRRVRRYKRQKVTVYRVTRKGLFS